MRLKAKLLVAAALAAFGGCNAFAQSTDTAAAAPTSSAKATKEAMKVENRQTARAVRRALNHTKGLATSDLSVFARAGRVTLAGTMPDQHQIDRAGAVAAKVSNVKSVDNRLTIRMPGR